METEVCVFERREWNSHEAMEGQQDTLDAETDLYVDDSSTLIHCENLRDIRGITIVETVLGDDELNALRRCASLTCISLLHCDGLEDLRVLAEMATLHEIHVYTRGLLEHVDSLSQLPALRRLSLNCCNIEAGDVCVLNRIPTLEYISVSRCGDVIHERGLDYVRSSIVTNDNVRDLCIAQNLVRINPGERNNLTNVTSLEAIQTSNVVNLNESRESRGVDAPGKPPGLTELDASETALSNGGPRGPNVHQDPVNIGFSGRENLTGATSLQRENH